MLKYCVGIDVSKNDLQLVVMEATDIYYEQIAMYQQQFSVIVVLLNKA